MNTILNTKILAWLVAGVGAAQLIPLVAALIFREETFPYLASAIASLVFGLSIALSARPTDHSMRRRDGFLVVGIGWILASLFGSLPYLLTGTLSPVDAIFESVAGFTTTGSTVISHIGAAPRGLLLWRALTQWLGGMGIIVFALAILPILGVGGMQLFRAEIPGPTISKLRPRIAATARRLLLIYAALTAIELIALWLAGLSVYDALCHALTTVSTGGFSTRDGSIGAYGSSTVEWIVIIFMLAGGINFTVHYYIATWQPKEVVRNLELRYFLGVVLATTVLIAWVLVDFELESQDAARTTLFQVVSIVTTTGYVTADFSRWPTLATMILLLLMILGGMTGSTSGGIKDMRAIMAFQVMRSTILRSLHSSAVVPVRYSGAPVPIGVLTDVWSFLTAYFAIAAATTALIAGAGYDLVTSVSASLTAIGNVGPGLGAVGPTETFVHFPGHVKLALSFCMIAGRLEVFTLLVLIVPRFWNR